MRCERRRALCAATTVMEKQLVRSRCARVLEQRAAHRRIVRLVVVLEADGVPLDDSCWQLLKRRFTV